MSREDLVACSGTSEYFVDHVLTQVELEGDTAYRPRGREQKFYQVHHDFLVAKAEEYKGDFDLGDLKYDFDQHFLKDGLTISLSSVHGILKFNGIECKKLKMPKEFRLTSDAAKAKMERRKEAALMVA